MENDLTNKCINKVNDGNIYRFADQDVLNILLKIKQSFYLLNIIQKFISLYLVVKKNRLRNIPFYYIM